MEQNLTIFDAEKQPAIRNSLAEKLQLAQIMSKSNIIPKISKDKPYSAEDIVSLFLIGERLGVDPIAALSGIWIVEGRPSVSARLCRALILKHGHKWRVEHWDAQSIKVTVTRKDDEPQTFEFTMKEAAHAGLTNRKTWQQHPRPMLMAAVTRRIVDAVFPDLFLGMTAYEQEEFDERPAVEQNVVDAKQAGKTRRGSLTLKKIQTEETEETEDENAQN